MLHSSFDYYDTPYSAPQRSVYWWGRYTVLRNAYFGGQ